MRTAVELGVWFSGGAAVMLAVAGLGNWWRFGSPFDLGYQHVDQSGSFVDGFAGQLLNPGRA